ncbi:hypothetical protein IQ276_011920 [Desmonostoc muscorum LEGE 12446]|uniref:TfuA-like core domain-containing protein n=1 Tax=Desmonostoc muscorum LEGE 12446 TaxID=1828758 RepID=A0A8J7DFY3_DESMC|nr:TfuA-like protein [Desmonostoc muscorum]MCF2147141.1 hypothetical protein [Desmonostoc muscorum LEGE 12446]
MNAFKSIAVFLGSSLPQNQAREVLDADYYPPARQGDVYRIMALGVETIVLVDGLFHSTPSVWQRELLAAIEEGIQVLGASSMGALRAAELHNFGMIGYGTIFEWYRDGVIDGDDEVALLHAPQEADFRPLSEPLVNIRYTLLKAIEDHYLTSEQAQQLTEYAKRTYYPDRSYRQLLNSPVLKNWSQDDLIKLEQYFRTKSIDLKRLDAIGVLNHCASLKGKRKPEKYLNSLSSTSAIWQGDQLLVHGFMSSQGLITGEKVLQEAQKDPLLVSAMYKTLSKQYFVLDWARQNSVCYTENLDAYVEQWKQKHGIEDGDWLRANGLTSITFKMLLEEHAFLDWIIRQGPDYFGLNWSFQQALEEELQLIGSAIQLSSKEQAYFKIKPLRMVSWKECKQESQDDPAFLVASSKSSPIIDESTGIEFIRLFKVDVQNEWSAELADIWLELSQRRFLLEWARQNGVSYPPDCLNSYVKQWEVAHGITDDANWLQATGLNLKSYRALLAERALAEWIVEQRPSYFGRVWNFKVALIRELQITGRVTQLVEKNYA